MTLFTMPSMTLRTTRQDSLHVGRLHCSARRCAAYFRRCCLVGLLSLSCNLAQGQFVEQTTATGPQLGQPLAAHKMRIGVVVRAVGGPCKNIRCTVPVPLELADQEVIVLDEQTSPEVGRLHYREASDGVRQLLITIPRIANEKQAEAIVTYQVTRRRVGPPTNPGSYQIPNRPQRQILRYLGDSPYIETRPRPIVELARSCASEADSAWQQVERCYDTARETLQPAEVPLQGTLRAVRAGKGSAEEITGLFVALCRASKIPARMVWVHGHCAAEFYLEDNAGKGHWFPCLVAGARAFGESDDDRPILQKGDNHRVPEKSKDRLRFVSEYLVGKPARGGGRPKVRFIREVVN